MKVSTINCHDLLFLERKGVTFHQIGGLNLNVMNGTGKRLHPLSPRSIMVSYLSPNMFGITWNFYFSDPAYSPPPPTAESSSSAFRRPVGGNLSRPAQSPPIPGPAPLRWAQSLHHLLRDGDGVRLFQQFLEAEGRHHADALKFWFACEGLRKEGDTDRIQQLVRVIYKWVELWNFL